MKFIVKVGSLGFEQGIFKLGDVIDVTPERAAQMDPNDIEAIPQDIEETKTMDVTVKKRVIKGSALPVTAKDLEETSNDDSTP